MKKARTYVPSIHHLVGTDLPGCHLVLNQPVKSFKKAFSGIPGIHIVADDIIIAAVNAEEHDKILRLVLERAKEKSIKFNFDKLQLRVSEVRYLGTMVTPEGIKPDLMKVNAIVEMMSPTDKAGIRRILGMINFLAAHIPNVSTITASLQSLLKSDTLFTWGPEQTNALTKIKEILSTVPVLSYFDPTVTSTIQADASQHGLETCLLQKGKPIAYTSRSLSPTESNYAQNRERAVGYSVCLSEIPPIHLWIPN